MDRAKSGLTRSVTSLPKNFRFQLEAFDCSQYWWRLPFLGPDSMPVADETAKADAIKWISDLKPQGATGTASAMEPALALYPKNKLVVLLTDGAPNCGAGNESGDLSCMDAHRSRISSANTHHAVIDVFAIGATGDFRGFCLEVAKDSGGSFQDVR